MLNQIMAGVIFFIGLGCLVAGGLAIVAFLVGCAVDYAWAKAKDAHNMAIIYRELKRLRKEGRLWGFKGDNNNG